MRLSQFNNLSHAQALQSLQECCHCYQWAVAVANMRPFSSLKKLIEQAAELWQMADEAQILEAFSGHARIGDIELLRSKFAGKAGEEQGQVLAADEAVLQRLQQLNDEYFERNGFIFIVCASGKSAQQMLTLLQARIHNSRDAEIQNGAREQGEITKLRLRNLITD
ncbi:2-oxo-4-hydroxy-4-carboxy-5-ureidoimidazoline decarboxylase [Neiella marina]|uniref:2-oxo-4-hydroxy-4-carboxy-5-ureidoimidazoline decarboxylase n=1 Tax=Neiella holothuriorum TaxID=2870530 RepID=A0ABS7EBX9_9GAMM|nr:2-oxo-4-hydroxy-4-carboxy-5-ureidoimidazoline decarboxylase [Neiella holothuriorum]MBW8189796.1 2-oxo-4-hydroxy-4-carboxy-5-ureidoimidazoline decarboxylase [Neiella holothuriorum]